MDTSTGHLIDRRGLDDYELRRRGLDPKAYTKVPESHGEAARRKLAGKAEAVVSLTSGGKLSRWAARDRREKRLTEKTAAKKERKDRQRAKQERRSRRSLRG